VISTILRHNNYRQLTASLQPTCVNSDICTVTTPIPTEVSGCGQLAGGLKVGRRYKCVSKQSGVYYTRYARIIHSIIFGNLSYGRPTSSNQILLALGGRVWAWEMGMENVAKIWGPSPLGLTPKIGRLLSSASRSKFYNDMSCSLLHIPDVKN